MDNLREGAVYTIEWTDGDYETNCTYLKEHRGFLIFEDNNGKRIFCRPTSIKNLTLLEG